MRYEILGPLQLVDRGKYSHLGAQKIQTILAVLLARADQVVTADQIMEEVWGDRLPASANTALYVYISKLRKFLRRAGCPNDPIVTRPPGYLLYSGTDEIDYEIYLNLVEQGRAGMRGRQYEEAARRFVSALALWRGPVLGDLCSGPLLDGLTARLMESRLECLELLNEAYLELGRHREIVGRLYAAIAEHPLREPFYRQLMVALYRSDCQADALRVYRTARRALQDELGLEPCRALQDVHHAILTACDGPGSAPRDGRRAGAVGV